MTDRLFVRLDEDETHGPEAAPPPGSLQSIPVAPPLQPYVSHILLYRESVPDGTEILERVIPDGALRLVVNLGDLPAASAAPPLGVVGPSASPAPAASRKAIGPASSGMPEIWTGAEVSAAAAGAGSAAGDGSVGSGEAAAADSASG